MSDVDIREMRKCEQASSKEEASAGLHLDHCHLGRSSNLHIVCLRIYCRVAKVTFWAQQALLIGLTDVATVLYVDVMMLL